MQIVELCFCPNTRLLLKHFRALHVKSQVTVSQGERIYNYLSIPEVEVKTTAPKGFLENKASKNVECIWITHLKAAKLERLWPFFLWVTVYAFSHYPNVPETISLKRLMIILTVIGKHKFHTRKSYKKNREELINL